MWEKGKVERSIEESVGNVTGNTFIGNVGNIIAGKENSATIVHQDSSGESGIQQISDAEWVELAKFFMEKQFSSNTEDKGYKEQYAMAEELTKKKDRKGLKYFFENAGGALLKIVLGAGIQTGIKGIINKIIKNS